MTRERSARYIQGTLWSRRTYFPMRQGKRGWTVEEIEKLNCFDILGQPIEVTMQSVEENARLSLWLPWSWISAASAAYRRSLASAIG